MQGILNDMTLFLVKNQWLAIVLALWAIPWKGIAIWKAARKNHLYWFVAFLVINTVGLLEILYIFYFSKLQIKKPAAVQAKKESGQETEIKIGEEIKK